MSMDRRKREAARPMNQRTVRPRLKVWKDSEGDTPGVLVELGMSAAFLSPAAVFELADKLVDVAERAEGIESVSGSVSGLPEPLQASTSATDTAC